MVAFRFPIQHKHRRAMAGSVLFVAAAISLGVASIPAGVVAAGGSDALAELAARSPGQRIGGVALKGKGKGKAKIARFSPALTGKAPEPQNPPVAVVLGSSPMIPEVIPGIEQPLTPAAVPGVFAAPAPGGPGPVVPIPGFIPPAAPPFIGVPGTNPNPNPEPTPNPTPNPTPTPTDPVPAVPEPSTWLMMIVGFGLVGRAMRVRRRAIFA
ncbi:MAG: PEPxxWA-CTERM sorting domain-containing protein [Altererythrobacter sp.]|nr:PEPxxWA-CTERM sorting domain-containing protein [Altererythrobacter sp.]